MTPDYYAVLTAQSRTGNTKRLKFYRVEGKRLVEQSEQVAQAIGAHYRPDLGVAVRSMFTLEQDLAQLAPQIGSVELIGRS